MTRDSIGLAILGGGPIGLEAALAARSRGFDVTVYEAGRVGAHLRRFAHVTLFTPFGLNSTEMGRARLRESRVSLPREEDFVTAGELVERYLAPLAALPELRGAVREGARVTHVGREGTTKPRGIAAVGDRSRLGAPFLLRVEGRDGAVLFEHADAVLDATGVYASANATGPGGVPAVGEESLGDRMERHIPDLGDGAGDRLNGRRVLLIGAGHSAATALVDLASLAGRGVGPARVEWVHREASPGVAFQEISNDPLPARRDLARHANDVAASAPWLRGHVGAIVESYATGPSGEIRVTLRAPSGARVEVDVDFVLALVGYRPDMELTRELQIHHCYASEAPMKLASAILAAGLENPSAASDCLSQAPHGAESLRNPEPDFYMVGAKSYGRGANFLLTLGHQQILDTLGLIEAEASSRIAVPSRAR